MGRRVTQRVSVEVRDQTTLPLFASAMRRQEAVDDLVRVQDRPASVSTGLTGLDRALRGGFPVGAVTLVASRPKAGATSLLIGASLAALKRGQPVAYFTERLAVEQVRGRFVVLESRVNGYRFRAGFVSAEDRVAIAAARERIPWHALSVVDRRIIRPREIDGHLFSYRPLLVVADVMPRGGSSPPSYRAMVEGVERLAVIAKRHRVSMVVRHVLPRRQHAPDRLELPGVGTYAEGFHSVLLMHRDVGEENNAGTADVTVVRAGGHDVEPRALQFGFDQRFAGLIETPAQSQTQRR